MKREVSREVEGMVKHKAKYKQGNMANKEFILFLMRGSHIKLGGVFPECNDTLSTKSKEKCLPQLGLSFLTSQENWPGQMTPSLLRIPAMNRAPASQEKADANLFKKETQCIIINMAFSLRIDLLI